MDPQSRRRFLMVALFSAVAAITFDGTGTEAAPNIGTGDTPTNIPTNEKVTAGEKVQLAKTVEQDDRVEGAYGYYGRARRVYRRSYRRTRRYVRRAYRRSYYY
jgi:hypothetical protein